MCGIFGHIGKGNSLENCIEGLKLLEYRGYDSVGIAGLHDGQIHDFKESGKISELEDSFKNLTLPFSLAIGQTRWATHGKPTKLNAHPHLDQNKEIALVHNGILENHYPLREMLKKRGVQFQTDTDTEVIVALIAYLYKGDIIEATRRAANLMEGFWAVALIHKDLPDQIIAYAKEMPLVIGVSKEGTESLISSDPHAFNRHDLDLYYLKNDEMAAIYSDHVDFFNQNAKELSKNPEDHSLEKVEISKGEYEHFMLKEIFEQPEKIQSAFHNRFIHDFGIPEFENLNFSKEELAKFKNVLILGCGSSWHAGCIAAQQIEEIAKIPARAEIASEFRYRDAALPENTLVIALSQSGETRETLSAIVEIKRREIPVIAICNVPGSSLVRLADSTILLRSGPEISVCATKSFTSLLTVLSLFSLLMARANHMNKEQGNEFFNQIIELPNIARKILANADHIASIARKYAAYSNFFFIGRQYMYPTSNEAALKLKEISYLNAIAYPAGELKHGPIALIDPSYVTIGLCGNRKTNDKLISNLTEVKARDGLVIAFANERSDELVQIADDVILLPEISDPLASIPYSIATQIFAYAIAKDKDLPIDKPRNLAKSVTVE